MSWTEFLRMGDYGLYVWSAYALAAVVLIVNVVLPLRERRTVRERLREYYRMQKQSR